MNPPAAVGRGSCSCRYAYSAWYRCWCAAFGTCRYERMNPEMTQVVSRQAQFLTCCYGLVVVHILFTSMLSWLPFCQLRITQQHLSRICTPWVLSSMFSKRVLGKSGCQLATLFHFTYYQTINYVHFTFIPWSMFPFVSFACQKGNLVKSPSNLPCTLRLRLSLHLFHVG